MLRALSVIAIAAALFAAGGSLPHGPASRTHGPASRTGLFPNAPRSDEWQTYADYQWGERPGGKGTYDKIPFWHDPTYDRDNGSHVVDYGSDAPADKGARPWPAQLSRLVVEESVPGGGKALEVRYPKGFPGGFAPARIFRHPRYDGDGLAWPPAENTGFLYLGLYFRFSEGFSVNGNVAQKLVYANSSAPTNKSINHVPLNLRTADGTPGLYPAYEPQNPFGLYQVKAERANNVNDGRWHLVEVLQEPNILGTKNGRIRIFIDGRLAGSWDNALLFEKGQTPSLNSLSLNPIYGGGNNPVPADQQLLLGPLRVMGH
jgi:hypothetical protein